MDGPALADGSDVAPALTASYAKQIDSSDRHGGPPNLVAHTFGGEEIANTVANGRRGVIDDGTGRGIPIVGFDGATHSLTGEGHDASEDGTGRGTPIVLGPARPGGELMPAVWVEDEDGGRWETCEVGAYGAHDHQPDGLRFAACGDGVAAPCAHWIGLRLRAAIEGRDPDGAT